jgi:hypothetical protein
MKTAGLRLLVLGCLGIALGACSSNNPVTGGGGGADNFVGTWTYAAGSMLTPMSCMLLGQTVPPISLAGQMLQITKIDDSHISALLGTNCNVRFTVSGTTATADAGQTCAITYQVFTVTLNVTSWTLTSAGGTLTSTESGTAPTISANCTATGNGTLTGMGG